MKTTSKAREEVRYNRVFHTAATTNMVLAKLQSNFCVAVDEAYTATQGNLQGRYGSTSNVYIEYFLVWGGGVS